MNPKTDDRIDPMCAIEETPESEKIITVQTVAPVGLDGRRVPVGKILKISVRQWRALNRLFKWIDGPPDHAPQGWSPPAPANAPAEK
jgi:hypothetical protein